jgi:hypothetical protein
VISMEAKKPYRELNLCGWDQQKETRAERT